MKVDVRLIAATNQDLQGLIAEGRFREDLFFRIQMLPIHLPPLRDRKIDVPLLARHFLQKFCEDNSLPVPRMSAEFQTVLLRSSWPGNVRELQSYVERSVIMSPGIAVEPVVLPSDLEPARHGRKRSHGALPETMEPATPPADLRAALEDVERRWIRAALDSMGGNQRQAATILGMAEPTLRYRMGRLGLVAEPTIPGGPGNPDKRQRGPRSPNAQDAARRSRK